VRFGNRDLVRRYIGAWRKLIGHGVAMPPDPTKRKGAPRAPWKVGSDFWKRSESLERRLDGAHRARVAGVLIETLLLQALGVVVVGIVVTDVRRPMV